MEKAPLQKVIAYMLRDRPVNHDLLLGHGGCLSADPLDYV
jgi:hypothetical protein